MSSLTNQALSQAISPGDVARTFGPFAIAWTLQLYLAGYAQGEAWRFFRSQGGFAYLKEGNGRWIISSCIILFAAMIFSLAENFHYMILPKTTLRDLYGWTTMDAIGLLPTAAMALSVQSYYALRCYRFYNRNIWIAGVLVFFTLSGFGACLGLVCTLIKDTGMDRVFVRITLSTWLWVTALADMSIWMLLMFKLRHFRREDSLASTESLIDRMVRLTFATAFPTAFLGVVAAIAEAIAGRSTHTVNVCCVFQYMLPPTYLLCLVYTIAQKEESVERRKENENSGAAAAKRGGAAGLAHRIVKRSGLAEKSPAYNDDVHGPGYQGQDLDLSLKLARSAALPYKPTNPKQQAGRGRTSDGGKPGLEVQMDGAGRTYAPHSAARAGDENAIMEDRVHPQIQHRGSILSVVSDDGRPRGLGVNFGGETMCADDDEVDDDGDNSDDEPTEGRHSTSADRGAPGAPRRRLSNLNNDSFCEKETADSNADLEAQDRWHAQTFGTITTIRVDPGYGRSRAERKDMYDGGEYEQGEMYEATSDLEEKDGKSDFEGSLEV